MAHYFITGHTGFKGAWMTLVLRSRGHQVSGLALDPREGGLFDRADVKNDLEHDFRLDIRDRQSVISSFHKAQPDVVVHMAAQALVRQGYRDPIATFETNVNGTLNVLEASDLTPSIHSQLIVTTDKVYRDDELTRPYLESDPLGGKDPYSASKAMSDILAQEFLENGRTKPGAIARAGNVIGLGDVSPERLIPDIQKSAFTGKALLVRYPHAVRPFQHVIDCIVGYLALVDNLDDQSTGQAFNFSPDKVASLSVAEVIALAVQEVGDLNVQVVAPEGQMVEAQRLLLDSHLARSRLSWVPQVGVDAVRLSLEPSSGDLSIRERVLEQIRLFDPVCHQLR